MEGIAPPRKKAESETTSERIPPGGWQPGMLHPTSVIFQRGRGGNIARQRGGVFFFRGGGGGSGWEGERGVGMLLAMLPAYSPTNPPRHAKDVGGPPDGQTG